MTDPISDMIGTISEKIDKEGKKDVAHVKRLYLDRYINLDDEDLYLTNNNGDVNLVVETECGHNCTILSLRRLLCAIYGDVL